MIIHISAGIHPPIECKIAVGLLLDSLKKEYKDIELLSFGKYEFINDLPAYDSVTIESSNIKSLDGTIQWICKSPVRENHKRKNWFIDASEIGEIKEVTKDNEFRFETFRSGGKGGQHQNTTDSGVRAIHIPTGIVTECREERSQFMNKARCIKKINAMLTEIEMNNMSSQKHEMWSEGNNVVRGNPIRVYEGLNFKRKI